MDKKAIFIIEYGSLNPNFVLGPNSGEANLKVAIRSAFTDFSTNEITAFDNPATGDMPSLLKKGEEKLVITASKAIGAYKIVKKTVKE